MRDSIERGWGERKVTVNREKLLVTLKQNLEKHREEYKASVLGYRQQATVKLDAKIRQARRSLDTNVEMLKVKIDNFDPEDPIDDHVIILQQTGFSLEVPKDHSRSYEVAIQMAEWEVGENIELTQAQFQCFVMDDWDWQEDFKRVTRSYSR